MESPRQPFEVTIRNNTHDQLSHEPVLGHSGLFPLVSVREGLVSASFWWEGLVSVSFGSFRVVSADFGSFRILVITLVETGKEFQSLVPEY